MECPFCKNPFDVCGDVDGPKCHISVPMTTFYWFGAFVPCCNRNVIGNYIDRLEYIATQENKPVGNHLFVTREGLEYEVNIDHGGRRTKIHGPEWQRFLDEYVVRPGDIVYICLPRGDGRFFVDVERDGIRQTPLPYIAMNGLPPARRELVQECVYTRGIELDFPHMRKMINRAFGPLGDVCCIFVHRLTVVDIRDGYIRIPKKAVALVENKTGQLADSGDLLLYDDAFEHVVASFKKAADGRLVIQGGFREYVEQLEMEEGDLVVITFHRRLGSPSTTVRVCIVS